MSSKRIVKDTIYYGIIPKLTFLISVFTLPLITPYLTTYDYGISGVISSYSAFMMSIAPLGLHVHLTNSYFEIPSHYNYVWGRVLYLMLISSFLFGCVNILVLMLTLPMDFSIEMIGLCVVGTIPVFLQVNSLLARHLFPLLQIPKPLVFTNLFGSVLGLLVSFVLIYYFRLGYWGLVASGTVSAVAVFLILLKYVWIDYDIKPIVEKNKKRIVSLLKVALPLVPHTLGFVLLTSSSRIVMSQLSISYDDIGLYTHGCAMGDYAVIITTALITAISPQIQRAYRSSDYSAYRKLYFLCQAIAVVSSLMICVWMPEIYSLLIRNENLAKSADIASLLCFANVVLAFYTFMSTPVFIEKNTMQLLWLVLVPGILNLALCYIFIPIWGYRVAIYSTIISYWSQLFIPYFVGYYRKSVRLWLGGLSRVLVIFVFLLCSLFLAQFLTEFGLLFKIVISMLMLSVFLFVYQREKLYQLV